jgi:hypothetical protein
MMELDDFFECYINLFCMGCYRPMGPSHHGRRFHPLQCLPLKRSCLADLWLHIPPGKDTWPPMSHYIPGYIPVNHIPLTALYIPPYTFWIDFSPQEAPCHHDHHEEVLGRLGRASAHLDAFQEQGSETTGAFTHWMGIQWDIDINLVGYWYNMISSPQKTHQ